MSLYLAVIGGCVIYVLLQLNQTFNTPEFSWRIFFRSNIIPTILNLVIGCALVAARKDLESIYPITFVSALILGVSGQAIFKKVQNIFDKKIDTVVGL